MPKDALRAASVPYQKISGDFEEVVFKILRLNADQASSHGTTFDITRVIGGIPPEGDHDSASLSAMTPSFRPHAIHFPTPGPTRKSDDYRPLAVRLTSGKTAEVN